MFKMFLIVKILQIMKTFEKRNTIYDWKWHQRDTKQKDFRNNFQKYSSPNCLYQF